MFVLKKLRLITRMLSVLPFLALLFSLMGPLAGAAEVTPEDRQAYLEALKDTREATQDEVFRKLLAIVPEPDRVNHARLGGGRLVWEGHPGLSRILVAAFMSRSTYNDWYKKNLEDGQEEFILARALWVTLVPELQNYFADRGAEPCPPSGKRIKQLLGLHPAYDYEVLVEMWMDPEDLFRPSADPEVTDHEAALAHRVSQNVWVFPYDSNPFIKLNAQNKMVEKKGDPPLSFKKWFINRTETIYHIGNVNDPGTWGYPWTRLGYSYDWGNAKNHVGVSEFTIRLDPARNGGEVVVKLHRAIDSAQPEWNQYFRCVPLDCSWDECTN
jgi:hypothetical protein